MSHVNVVFVRNSVALDVDDLPFVDRDHLRSPRPRDLGHVLLVALHPSADDRKPQPRGLRRERGALPVALRELAQFVDCHIQLLLLVYFPLQGRFLLLRHRTDVRPGVPRIALELLALRRELLRHRIERTVAAVQLLLFDPDLFGKAGDVAHLAFAQRRHFAQRCDLAGYVGEIPRCEEIGQVIVVPVIAVGFADHLGILRAVVFERCREVSCHAVLAGDLLAQQRSLLFGLFEQLVPRVDLAGQTPHPLFGRRTPLLELRNLPLLVGNTLFEVRNDLLLLLDAAVGLGPDSEGEKQGDEEQKSGRFHTAFIRRVWFGRAASSAVRSAAGRIPFPAPAASRSRP